MALILKCTINLLSSQGQETSSVSTNLSKANVSSNLGGILGTTKQIACEPFYLGISGLGQGGCFDDIVSKGGDVDYFIGEELSNSETGNFDTPITITLNGSNITHFTLIFDTYNYAFPTNIKVDNTTYINDDPFFTIQNLDESNSHTITIYNWSKKNRPLIITGIEVGLNIEITLSKGLISYNGKIESFLNEKLPEFGVLSNSANIEFIDLNGEIADYIRDRMELNNLTATVTIESSVLHDKVTIGTWKTSKWNYDNYSKNVSIEMVDGLEELQNILVPSKIIYRNRSYNAYSYLNDLKELTPSRFKFRTIPYSSDVYQIMSNTYFYKSLQSAGTLWKQYDNLCKACGLYMYRDSGGYIVFTKGDI